MTDSFGQDQLVLARDAQPVLVTIVNNHEFFSALEQAGGIDDCASRFVAIYDSRTWGNRGNQDNHSNTIKLGTRWLAIWLADAGYVVGKRVKSYRRDLV